MSIIDGMRDQRAIQHVGVEFAGTVAAGDCAIIHHTNGLVYSIFARNYNQGGVIERRLYMSWSSDSGNTWATAVQLSSGAWDDEPTAIQLDLTSTSSLIGVVYNSGTYNGTSSILHRFTVNTSGVTQSPLDPLFANTGFMSPSLVAPATGGFTVLMIDANFGTNVLITTNSVFTDNSWTTPSAVSPSPFLGSSTNQLVSMNVKNLPLYNVLLALITARTALDGANEGDQGNPIAATVRCDVFASVSTDGGNTWSGSPQNLTGYSGTPEFDLVGIDNAISADLMPLSDGTIAVAFQESTASQIASADSAFPIATGAAHFTSGMLLLPSRNLLFMAVDGDNSGQGGLYVFDMTGKTRTKISTSTTPAIWTNNIQAMDIDSTGTYLALAENGSLDIINISDPTIANWTTTGLRTGSTPAILNNDVLKCKFIPGTTVLVFSYGSGSISSWGGSVDVSTFASVTNYGNPTVGYGFVKNFYFQGSNIVIYGSTSVSTVTQSVGTVVWNQNAGTSYDWGSLFYDSVNSKIWVGGSFAVTGGTFDNGYWPVSSSGYGSPYLTPSSVHGATAVGNIAVRGGSDQYNQEIPGIGIVLGDLIGGPIFLTDFYSYTEQKFYGPVTIINAQQQNEMLSQHPPEVWSSPLDARWQPQPGLSSIAFNDLLKVGRIRWGVFGFNSGTNSLVTSGVNFYDLLNPLLIDSTLLGIRRFAITVDSSNQLYALLSRLDYTRTTEISAMLNGFLDTDAFLLQVGCRIKNTSLRTVQSRARILQNTTYVANVRARIIYQSTFTARAHIIPYFTVTFQARARIATYQEGSIPGYYQISASQAGTLRGIYTFTGLMSSQSIGAGANILGSFAGSVIGSFALAFKPTGKPSFAVKTNSERSMMVGAFIQR